MLTNAQLTDQVAEQVITSLTVRRDTETLSQLVTERHDCLRQLAELGCLAARSGAGARHEPVARAAGRQAASAGWPAGLGAPARSVSAAGSGRAAVDQRRGSRALCAASPPRANRCWRKSCARRSKASKKCTSTTMPRPSDCKRPMPRPWRAAPTLRKIAEPFDNSTFPRIGKPR